MANDAQNIDKIITHSNANHVPGRHSAVEWSYDGSLIAIGNDNGSYFYLKLKKVSNFNVLVLCFTGQLTFTQLHICFILLRSNLIQRLSTASGGNLQRMVWMKVNVMCGVASRLSLQ